MQKVCLTEEQFKKQIQPGDIITQNYIWPVGYIDENEPVQFWGIIKGKCLYRFDGEVYWCLFYKKARG